MWELPLIDPYNRTVAWIWAIGLILFLLFLYLSSRKIKNKKR